MKRQFITSLLYRHRTIGRYLIENTSSVLDHLMSIESVRYMIYPCDVIDLRTIFKDRVIEHTSPICLFDLRFAERYFTGYSVFLVVDSMKIEFDTVQAGGMKVFITDSIDIDDKIARVVVNSPTAKDCFSQVKKLVQEFKMPVEVLQNNTVPGVDMPVPKMTSSKKKYKIAQIDPSIQIQITPEEQNIFEFIVGVKQAYNLPTRLMVAGGWVRDKLLGKKSDDIDIAVQMPGSVFAQKIRRYADEKGLSHNIVGDYHNSSMDKNADPTQRSDSPDLMVGAIPIYGIKVEFVPMRKETYPDPTSRRPLITRTDDPAADATRRDLTINALFYDIEDKQVRDYVGGVRDLGLYGNNSIYLRTPPKDTGPVGTFLEDPLRVLRVLRFHSKFPGSMIDEEVIKAMRDPEVQKAYIMKVSSSRAGPEIMKMLMGKNPISALRLLFETGLYKNVFKVPSMEGINPDGIMMNQNSPYHQYNLLDHTLKVVDNLNRIMQEKGEDDKMRGVLNLAALFHDFGKMKVGKPHPKGEAHDVYYGHEDESVKMADEIMDSLGFEQDDKEIAHQVILLHMEAIRDPESWSKKRIGKFMRRSRPHGKEEKLKDLWKYILYHAEADAMSSRPEAYDPIARQNVLNQFNNYTEVPAAGSSVTVLNGNEIQTLFPDLRKETGFITPVKEKLLEWQDEGKINLSLGSEEAKRQAIDLLSSNQAEVRERIQEYISMRSGGKMAINWYKKYTQAQTVKLGPCNCPPDPEVVKGPVPTSHRYQKGMRIRDRRKGLVNPQEYGIVDKVDGNTIKIVWNPEHKKKRHEQILDAVEDTQILSFLIMEV